ASPQFSFCSLPVLDIGGRPVPFDNVARLIAQGLGSKQKPTIFAIEAPEPSFKLAPRTGFPYCTPLLQHALLVVRMKSASPAGFGLVQGEAGVVKGRLMEEVGTPVGSSAPDQRRDCVDDQSKAVFGLLDFVKGLLQRLPCCVLCGDIHMRAN